MPRIDLVEVSCGILNYSTIIRSRWGDKNVPPAIVNAIKDIKGGIDPKYPLKEGYTLDYAKVIKQMSPKTIVASVGGFKKKSSMENALTYVDLVSLGRPFIREPDLCFNLRTKSDEVECHRCGQCIAALYLDNMPIKCFSKFGFQSSHQN